MTLLNNYQYLLPFNFVSKIGSLIDFGVDGEVYHYAEEKAIKICQYNADLDQVLDQALEYLSKYKEDPYAYIYEYGLIQLVNSDRLYYYVMDRLNTITEDEWKVFHSIISHEDRNIVKNFSEAKLDKILFGLARGLDFDEKRVKFFYEALRKSQIKHLDLHPRNIMKDNRGNFKLVDFNRIRMEII